MTETLQPTAVHRRSRHRCKVAGAMAVGFWSSVAAAGEADRARHDAPWQTLATVAPQAEVAAPAEAWRMAQAYAATRAGSEVVLGLGDSMRPLYRERTLLVIERLPFQMLVAGMTVVFAGDDGWPVAHVLVNSVRGGWQAAGLANRARDTTLVTPANYRGTVTKAYELTWPRVARAQEWSEFRAAPDRSGTSNLAVLTP